MPYFISSHPGSTLDDAIELALFLKRERIRPQQEQDFYPTPGTLATCMYHTGLDPESMKPVYTAKAAREALIAAGGATIHEETNESAEASQKTVNS